MPDNNKDRANLGEQGGRRSSTDDVLSRSGIERTQEDLKKLEKDVDDLTIRRGTERDRDVRERTPVEREGGKFERGRSETRESSTRDTDTIRRASETPKESDTTGTGSKSDSTGGAAKKSAKVAGSGFTMEETEESKKGYSSAPDRLERSSESGVRRSGSLSEPERKEDRSIDRNRDIDRSKM